MLYTGVVAWACIHMCARFFFLLPWRRTGVISNKDVEAARQPTSNGMERKELRVWNCGSNLT